MNGVLGGSAKKTVVVVDGLGGGIGEELVKKLVVLSEKVEPLDIIALATNSTAAARMVKAGASRGASGENAIKRSVNLGDFILGPIGVIIANSMLGEITCGITQAVLDAPGRRILIPLQNDHIILAGVEGVALSKMIEKAVEAVEKALKNDA
ncbi:MAG: DUF3842 family protein [Spirochaetaceae bacterium]|jgi:hypothetical protein|nr:DUF3842 family protein [Spirochaetaceae bacterium]